MDDCMIMIVDHVFYLNKIYKQKIKPFFFLLNIKNNKLS